MLFVLVLTLPVEAQFGYVTNNGTITITYYFGSGGAVTIPSSINGLPVTVIGTNAFLGDTQLTNVGIPETVTNIGYQAFCYCSNLRSVTIGTNTWTIEGAAFFSCTSLTNVVIPDHVTSIGDQAFHNCTSLTAITVDDLNHAYSSLDGVLFNQSKTTLIECPARKTGSFSIPYGVTTVADEAFQYCGRLTNINISDSVTNTGIATFQYCSNLTAAVIGTNVTIIGDQAFQYCANLATISIPNTVTDMGNNTFQYCGSLASATLSTNIDVIGIAAFMYCSNLLSVYIPNGVTNIGDFAFCGCTRLSSVTIPDSVITIGGWAFDGCGLKSLRLGNGVTSIGQRAFLGCSTLTTGVTIPASVTNIGDYGFAMNFRVPGFFFLGNPPSIAGSAFWDDLGAKAYYMPGTTNWSSTLGDLQTMLWNATIELSTVTYDPVDNGLSFVVTGNTNIPVVVEGGVDLKHWLPFQTFTLSSGSFYFSDAEPYELTTCFYRVHWP
jgi:hypothetical protein